MFAMKSAQLISDEANNIHTFGCRHEAASEEQTWFAEQY